MKNQYFGDINDYRKYGILRGPALACGEGRAPFPCAGRGGAPRLGGSRLAAQ
jgi:hypothetical protein